MREVRELLGRSALLAGARVVSKVATLAVVLSVARRLTIEDFGLLGTMLAYTTFAGLISDFGLLLPTLRGMSQGRGSEAQIFGRTIWPRIVWGGASAVGLLAGGFLLDYPLAPLGLFVTASLAESFFTALVRSHEARQAMARVTVFVIAERLSYALWVFAALEVHPTISAIAAASLASTVIMLALSAFAFRRAFGWSWPRFDWNLVRAGTAMGFPLFAASILSTAYYRLDMVLLEQFISPAEAGVYSAAMRIVEALMFIPLSIMSTVFPMLSSSYEADVDAFRSLLYKAVCLLGGAGVLVGGVIVVWAEDLVSLLFGASYVRSGAILQILGPMLFFYCINALATQALVAMRQDRVLTVVTAAAAASATALNVFLIPRLGAVSSASVRVGIEGVMAVTFIVVILRLLRLRNVENRGVQA